LINLTLKYRGEQLFDVVPTETGDVESLNEFVFP